MVSRRKILSRSRDDLTLGEERTKHTQVATNVDTSRAFKMMPHYYFLFFLGWHLVLKRETLQGSRWGGEEKQTNKQTSFANTSEIYIFSLKTRTPHVQNISLLSFILKTNSWLAFVRFCENGTPLTMKSGQRPSSWKGIRGSQRWEW